MFLEHCRACCILGSGLHKERDTFVAKTGVVGLSEIDDFDHHGLGNEDVVGFQIEVHNIIHLEITHGLNEHEEDVDLGVH